MCSYLLLKSWGGASLGGVVGMYSLIRLAGVSLPCNFNWSSDDPNEMRATLYSNQVMPIKEARALHRELKRGEYGKWAPPKIEEGGLHEVEIEVGADWFSQPHLSMELRELFLYGPIASADEGVLAVLRELQEERERYRIATMDFWSGVKSSYGNRCNYHWNGDNWRVGFQDTVMVSSRTEEEACLRDGRWGLLEEIGVAHSVVEVEGGYALEIDDGGFKAKFGPFEEHGENREALLVKILDGAGVLGERR